MSLRTLRLYADPGAPTGDLALAGGDLARAAAILRGGGTVAFATETVYGLGANALDPAAVAKIFAAKQRPAWDPLIVHIADDAMLARVASPIAPAAGAMMERFWPGPLTLLLPRSPAVPDAVTAGRPLVGVRMPSHPVALALIRAAGVPIAAPSANTFGHVSPTRALHVLQDLDGRIDAILDSGPTLHGVESTVVDASGETCRMYRPGAITLEQLRALWPATELYAERGMPEEPSALPAPGVGLRHYAPRARLVLIETERDGEAAGHSRRAVGEALARGRAEGLKTGLMKPSGADFDTADADATYVWGPWNDKLTLAQRLFAGLRELDDGGVELIVCPLPGAADLGLTIRDRLHKAARRS